MKLFRYKNSFGELILLEYNVLRETPAGYWICTLQKGKGETWVARTGKKRFAYPTAQEALTNFIYRTERYLLFTKQYMDFANEALAIARRKEV
uniref:Uncharacterized protein n=1 Tax=viral metagenome TaxID=1070528 RepID=A0A6M3LBY0_9ZZZZ